MDIDLQKMPADLAAQIAVLGAGAEPIQVKDAGEVVAAIISADDFEFLVQLKTRMAIQVLREELSNTADEDWKPLERLINKLADGLEDAGSRTGLNEKW